MRPLVPQTSSQHHAGCGCKGRSPLVVCGIGRIALQVSLHSMSPGLSPDVGFDNSEIFMINTKFFPNFSFRFVTSWVRVETSPGHVPVATISWSPCSNYLVSGSPADTNLVVWEVPMGVASRVGRREGGGVSLVRVAPRGGRVFAASVGGVMRIWEMESWTCEKWTTPGWGSGRCQAACWSPEGDFLVFSLSGDHALYYLCYRGNNTGMKSHGGGSD